MSMTSKAGTFVEIGSKWEGVRHMGIHGISPFKVIGFADRYVVMRRKNAMPICAHINTFGTEYFQVVTSKEAKQ
jgi:hypothetical protein